MKGPAFKKGRPLFLEIMKITGITAEYNPLHKGHIYQIEQARSLTAGDAVAVAMSGDYVQRGEPAILDKWTRCGLALDSGADLVVEIPVQFCLGNASQYAAASVSILEALGCSSISFGSECGDAGLLSDVAAFLDSDRAGLDEMISQLTKTGMNYPSARSEAYRRLRRDTGKERLEAELAVLDSPNDILAIEYIRNLRSAVPVCVKREGAGYSEGIDRGLSFQSAGAIRNELCGGKDPASVGEYVPECTLSAISRERLTFPDEWSLLLRYAAAMASAETIEDCPSAGEGLGNLIKKYAGGADGPEKWGDIVKAVKSKRYTYTRISRLCMQLVLGMTRSTLSAEKPLYIRVLGFNEKGRKILAGLKSEGAQELPVITNINKEAQDLSEDAARMLALDVRAADVYNLVTGRGREFSDHVRKPLNK